MDAFGKQSKSEEPVLEFYRNDEVTGINDLSVSEDEVIIEMLENSDASILRDPMALPYSMRQSIDSPSKNILGSANSDSYRCLVYGDESLAREHLYRSQEGRIESGLLMR